MLSTTMLNALSGARAASLRLNVSAHNIANQHTPDAAALQSQQKTLATGGVTADVAAKNPATRKVAIQAEPTALPNTDLATEVVEQTLSTYDFKANLTVIKAADEMTREAINMQA